MNVRFSPIFAALVMGAMLPAPTQAEKPSPFDGKILDRWTTVDGKPVPAGWEVVDGEIHLIRKKDAPRGGTIVTADEFGDFDLSFEFKIAPKGNSGIKYRVRSYEGKVLGLEYQVYDDVGTKTSLQSKNATGSIYDLFEPGKNKKLKPAGEYNTARIIVRNDRIEHWLNGERIVAATVGDAEWKRRVAQSKFHDAEDFSENHFGKLMLTDHGSEAWYRNFKFEQFPTEPDKVKPKKPVPEVAAKPKKPATMPVATKPQTKPGKPTETKPSAAPKPAASTKPQEKQPEAEQKPAAKVHKETIVYKKVDGLEIKADVYLGADRAKRPVVVWVHGGALINGHRESVPAWLSEAVLPRGYALVSIDYRLAPETKLPDLVDDVEDSLVWIRKFGPQLFGADPKRVAVVGGSAGGYLTLVMGYRSEPRPTALVSLWGYGDLGAEWTYEASSYPRHQQLKFAADDVKKFVGLPAVCDSRERTVDAGPYYQFTRRTGRWAEAVSGWNPQTRAARFLPFMPERNVSPDYPPTLLIHGDADTDVPYDSSARMADEFKRHGVPHRFITFKGAEHGLSGADAKGVADAYRAAVEFLVERLEAK
jgi:acetyl esterase/lipase